MGWVGEVGQSWENQCRLQAGQGCRVNPVSKKRRRRGRTATVAEAAAAAAAVISEAAAAAREGLGC